MTYAVLAHVLPSCGHSGTCSHSSQLMLWPMAVLKLTNLASMMGEQKLSKYIKLFDITLGLEDFLTNSKLTEEEADIVEKVHSEIYQRFCRLHQPARRTGNEISENSFIESIC